MRQELKLLKSGKPGRRSRKISLTKPTQKSVWSWALYDWANSAYATTVMAGFFPLFFKQYWSAGTSAVESTYTLGLSNAGSSLVIAVLAPFLGAMADYGFGKKIFLAIFTLLGAIATISLFFVGQGSWQQAAVIYAISGFAFSGAMVFYDSLLVDVSLRGEMDRVSSLGYSLGYLGGGILFAVNVLMYLKPSAFGLADGVSGIKWAFASVGVWWILFSLPLFIWVKEPRPATRPPIAKLLTGSWQSLVKISRKIIKMKPLLWFIAAYMVYIDGVNTIIKMAVDYGMSIGFTPSHLISALLLVQFVGFPAAIGFGYLASRIGPRPSIFICLWVYGLMSLFAALMTQSWHFYVLAAMIGLVQGGVQALSRSIYARMIPTDEAAEYFGFFNLLGKFSAVLGPLLVGLVSLWTNEPRWSIMVLVLMFVLGGWLLRHVDVEFRV